MINGVDNSVLCKLHLKNVGDVLNIDYTRYGSLQRIFKSPVLKCSLFF